MNVVVTGGLGFIGSHLVERLVRQGHVVRIIDNCSSGSKENVAAVAGRVEIVTADLSVVPWKSFLDTEIVFHLGANPSIQFALEKPKISQRSNEVATLAVLDAALHCNVRRVIYASSAAVYGNSEDKNYPCPANVYGAGKLAGEDYMRTYSKQIETVSLRMFNAFGPRQKADSAYSNVIPLFINKMIRGERPTIFGDGEQTRDWVYVDNLVDAFVLAMNAEKVSGEAYDIGTGTSASLNMIVTEINAQLGTNIVPEHAPERSGDIRHSRADLTAASTLLGYKAKVDWWNGLRQYTRFLIESRGPTK